VFFWVSQELVWSHVAIDGGKFKAVNNRDRNFIQQNRGH
jgi:hypothetical protein